LAASIAEAPGIEHKKIMPTTHWQLRYTGHLGLYGPDLPLFLHSVGSADPIAQIRFLAELGFAGVQDNFLKLRAPELQARMGEEMARLGLAMGTFTNNPLGWNRPLWGSTDAAARYELRRDLDATIEAARRVGGHCATCVTGSDAGAPRERQLAAMVENLKWLSEPAQRAGIVLCVEAVAARWIPGLLVDHLDDALAIVRAVDSPAVRLLFDIGHLQMSDGNVLDHLDQCWDAIGAIQLADAPGRTELGSGELNWPNILRRLRDRGWQGLTELELRPSADSVAGERRVLEQLRTIDAAI
jgi:hydroxypyruvate isomerase